MRLFGNIWRLDLGVLGVTLVKHDLPAIRAACKVMPKYDTLDDFGRPIVPAPPGIYVARLALQIGWLAPSFWARIPKALVPHLRYLGYVLRHKFYVYQECRKLGVPRTIALLHDWDKFLPDEWLPYVNTFYAPDGTSRYAESPEFAAAWNLHQKRNKHHWQWWLLTRDRGETVFLPMSDLYRREMLADWRGAGRAMGDPDTTAWYLKNSDKILLHPETRSWIEKQLLVSVDCYLT